MQKMQLHNIINNTLRLAMLLVALFAVVIPSHAAVPEKAEKLNGDGTVASPFLISNVNEFMCINDQLGSVYRQTADLNFEDFEFTDYVIANFTGKYDGYGYTIKNVKIHLKTTDITGTNSTIGLFKTLGNETSSSQDHYIRNLLLDNIKIEYNGNANAYAPASGERFIEIGILCGSALKYASITNVIIKNSQINIQNDPCATNYFVGGLVGDVRQNADTGSGEVFTSIKNISVSADIDVSKCTRHSSAGGDPGRSHQFMVGGIVGRIRTGKNAVYPLYTYYEGTIKAPIAMVGPCYGGGRYAQKTIYGGYFTSVYAGQIKDPGTSTNASDNSILGSDANANRYYGNYQVLHYDAKSTSDDKLSLTKVTDKVPSGGTYYYDTRTFSSNYPYSDNSTTVAYKTAEGMASFQGVNHGKYAETYTPVLDMFSKYVESNNGLVDWQYSQNMGFYFTIFNVKCTAEDTYVPTIRDFVPEAEKENYQIKWTLTKCDGTEEILRKDITSPSLTLCISTEDGLSSNDVRRYKAVKAELINKEDDDFQTDTYEFDLPEIGVNISRFSLTTFKAKIWDDNAAKKYKHCWFQVKDGVRSALGDVISDRESNYSFGSEDDLPQQIEVEVYDINGDIYYFHDGSPVKTSLEVSNTIDQNIVSNYQVRLSRKEVGKDTYFVARIYDGDGNYVAGGHPDDADYLPNQAVTYQWLCTRDISDTHNFTYISNTKSYFKGYASENFYKVTAYYNGWEMSDYAILGNKDVIFVYDKNKQNEANPNNNQGIYYGNGNLKKTIPLTTFDGIDRWTEDGVEKEGDYPDGNDDNDGRDPYRAVKSIEKAYTLLDAENGPDDNIIVIMGFNYEPYFLNLYCNTKDTESVAMLEHCDAIYNKSATITGKRGKISGGAIVLSNTGKRPIGLRAATKFENINLAAAKKGTKYVAYGDDNPALYLYCQLHDITFGENIVMRGYSAMTGNGAIDDTNPQISIMGGFYNFNVENGDISQERAKCEWNQDEDFTTITIQSGCLGRIIGGSRVDDDFKSVNHNIFGNPTLPHRVRMNVDIKHNSDVSNEFWPDGSPSYDVGLLAGGQTDGTVYSEAELIMTSGTVGRFISGNISYGRDVGKFPFDSFFGSTTFTFRGGTIQELYGGSLGRSGGGAPRPYFYGRSIINIEGGIVMADLNGAGAGGVAGVGTDKFHTDDPYIPYWNDNDKTDLQYGNYDTSKGKVIEMVLADGKSLDFANTYSEINVRYGILNGDVFGAGGGYSKDITVDRASSLAGNLYGECRISISEDESLQTTLIKGNVYGAGAGSDEYYKAAEDANKSKFTALAQLHGNCKIEITGGTIEGDVFAGAMGIEGLPDMAASYGNTDLTISGGKILGNIYGGSGLANIRRVELSKTEADAYGDLAYSEGEGSSKKYYLKDTGNTYVNISGGIIGNCIFGGSMGNDATKATIDGDTHVTVTGGQFIDTPYIDVTATDDKAADEQWDAISTPENYRNFNIYGGGNVNCDINGTAYLKLYTSLLASENSFMLKTQNPNALTEHTKSERFQSAYMDITYRRFCVYGGGKGALTTVGNTDVYVTIPPERLGVTLPHGNTLDTYLPQQSFFDIAGGGYSGDVGYWVDENGKRIKDYTQSELNDLNNDSGVSAIASLYHSYVGGNCKVVIDGYTYARKIIGGGFYGSCNNTNTHVRCGSLRQVYGGCLLGDVHQRAYLQFGNRVEDFIRKVDGSYIYDVDGGFNGIGTPYQGDRGNVSADVLSQAAARAKELNDYIFITENIYGGNDVKGIIGTKKWEAPNSTPETPIYALATNFQNNSSYQEYIYPLFCTNDASILEDCGIVFNIYGGTFMGDVYGAGNGHYRGYYVPEWVRYTEGPAHLYRKVKSGIGNSNTNPRVYDGRPMVGNVNINIRGNSSIDRIHFTKNFYGGGRECTIGQWNTLLPVEDPRRLVEGGHLHVNFGGYVDIDGNVYMGSEGSLYATQPTVPAGVDFSIYKKTDSKKTANIDKLGDIAYYHWYYDNSTGRYLPGFPPPGKTDENYGFCGEHMFRAYLKNIEMECDVELTFYRNLYDRNATTGEFEYEKDGETPIADAYGTKLRKRKRWIPYEMAVVDVSDKEEESVSYDAQSITMTSFFLGGACGSMSNNKVMDYAYDSENNEKYPSIYRVSLPKGVLIKDAVVMGSQEAQIDAYAYSDADCTTKDPESLLYSYQGGMVTHSSIAFDLIVYNDKYSHEAPVRDLPSDFYDDGKYTDIKNIAEGQAYTIQHGPDANTKIKRKRYGTSQTSISGYTGGQSLNVNRYDFAVVDSNTSTAYIGPRAKRAGTSDHLTVVKLGASCKFQPQLYDPEGILANATEDEKHAHRHGGIIYGGCYTSGITIGDVVLNVASDMLGDHYVLNSPKAYGEFSRLKYNKGRVFGGGFGPKTEVQGNTYVNLINGFRGMNVFGGGMQGNVTGTANVTYIGKETESYVYGAIYGGGLQGSVGTKQFLTDGTTVNADATAQATIVRLFSGNVDKVYGGSCMGDIYGCTFVEIADEVQAELDHLDYDRLKDRGYEWTDSRLIAGTVYGCNDIAGNITSMSPAPTPTDPEQPKDYEKYFDYTSTVYVHEVKNEDAKTTPGSDSGYNGFPLIGSLYGGSNGQYGVHGEAAANGTVKYVEGEVELATGTNIETQTIHLDGEEDDHSDAYVVPTIDDVIVEIKGGSIIDAYTGGNMATINGSGTIRVDYDHPQARAGFETTDELERVWNALHLSAEEQQREVVHLDENGCPVFNYNIIRLFGGNNNADMAIQPEIELIKGEMGSVFSGGNFGKMTYYKPAEGEEKAKGLTLSIDSEDISIDNLYGGGRVGDIYPMETVTQTTTEIDPVTSQEVTTTTTIRQLVSSPPSYFYGATLNVDRGTIRHLYGGNDVAGTVEFGTNVNLHGAISGDVYCAGNGNYPYKYDSKANLCDYSQSKPKILEDYMVVDAENNTLGDRYFILPAKSDYGYVEGKEYQPTDAQVVMAINSYRPHVGRTKFSISGKEVEKTIETNEGTQTLTEIQRVWVSGNVYCGGNSATVASNSGEYDVVLDIGDYVTLNGVFLGSNGESLALGSNIKTLEDLNGLDLTEDNDLEISQLIDPDDHAVVDYKETLYPKLLDLYMRAVETNQQPKDFEFSPTLKEAYIGEFCVGGNRGSIMTDKRIVLDFPEALTIYGRIIGGSKNANVSYNGVTHVGGFTMPLEQETVKLEMKIRSTFRPLDVKFPDATTTPALPFANRVVAADGGEYESGDKYYPDKQCNIYGGCYTSGKTVGDIRIDLYSDMLNYKLIDDAYAQSKTPDATDAKYVDPKAIINSIAHPQTWRAFTVVGAGYGADTEVWGNIDVRMLPTVTVEDAERTVKHPSVGTIFCGSQEGLVVGNTNVEIRDGKVLANVYGGSEAAKMYGSTSVIVGYPKYYRVKKTGNYRIKRADYMSEVATGDLCDEFGEVVVPKAVAYREGDILAQNVYDMMLGRIKDSRIKTVIDTDAFKVGKTVADEYVELFAAKDDSGNYLYPIETYFEPVESAVKDNEDKPKYDHIVPEDFGAKWDDITIWVGDQYSNIDPKKPYYGQGNIYGGGYIPNSSDRTLIGQPTIMRYTEEYNPGILQLDAGLTNDMEVAEVEALQEKFTKLYGGNTSVIIWDNKENADYSKDLTDDTTADASKLKDHVHIGTGYFKNVEVTEKSSARGLFKKLGENIDIYIYQTVGKIDTTAMGRYYEKLADGGVYGGGRKVFAEAFRTIDLAYYGYAEHTPQQPKILNTIQRADVATITDCCMELVGASDFTLSNYKDIYYAINRVGELRMWSSLNPDDELDVGVLDTSTDDHIMNHNKKRSRNFIALYNRTNQLGSFRSNWTFENIYHTADGAVAGTEADDYNSENAYPAEGGKVSYVNRKHRYIDVYDKYHALYLIDEAYYNAKTEEEKKKLPQVQSEDITELQALYKACTDTAFVYTDPEAGKSLLTDDVKNSIEDLFKQRNVGTSGNMIGISSGYELSFEGVACQRGETTETRYYGPAYGITEIKLMTTVSGMGGGYVYALNHHYDPDIDGAQAETQTSGWCSKWGRDFLQTTGNFVFPGATYHTDGKDKTNYIIDDCFDHYDPVNHGYYECVDTGGHDRVITKAPRRETTQGEGEDGDGDGEEGEGEGSGTPATTPSVDVNAAHEIHYWYVSGNTYVYNVTITGITSDTTPEEPRDFWIDNTNGLVNLFNVKEGTAVRVTEVMWFEHEQGSEVTDCDFTHHDSKTEGEETKEYLPTQYKLYLTLFDQTRNTLTTDVAHPGAYVTRIPRHSYKMDDDENDHTFANTEPDYGDYAFSDTALIVHPNNGIRNITVNDYKNKYVDAKGDSVLNHPRLGIRLMDGQKNRLADEGREAGTEYYNKHLAGDHNLQVTLETRNGTDERIFYIINIDIRYLVGPAMFGDIEIENCALPGEYIYANANDVEVVMDENLGVSKQMWRMYPNVDGERITVAAEDRAKITDPDVKYDAKTNVAYYDLDKAPFTIENTEKEIHIPAYLYYDGWELAYEVEANGEYFEATLPYYGTKEVADPQNNSQNITVTDSTKVLYNNRLQVHNYHRMKPIYNDATLDLRLTADARIYIEDQDDMDYFFEYLDKMQSADVPTGYKRFTVPTGKTVNPQNCKDLDFYLMKSLNVPTTSSDKDLTFAGSFHGMGYNLTIPNGDRYGFVNNGDFYNLGFISKSTEDDSHAFSQNNGSLYNCFYFNPNGTGSFLGGTSDHKGKLSNCYENTLTQARLTELGYSYNEILHLSTEGFRYGQAAYNLNGYYLQKRHILLHGPSSSDKWTTANNSFALIEKDKDLRLNAQSYTPYEVPYIESYFNNGDYRYACIYSTTQPEGLRTAVEPNYYDRLNNRKNGLAVSMHDATPDPEGKGLDGHRIDATRWCDNHGEYHPQFEEDYIFFGQNQTVDVDEYNNTLPTALTSTNRVYRVGGFYGSAADKGYYFNRHAYLDSPLMTAVDFVGYRDRDLYGDDGYLKADDRTDIDDNGWVIKQAADVAYSERQGGWQEVYYPPSIDLPWVMGDDGVTPMHDFEKFTLVDSKVTHNLLVYTRDNDKAAGYLTEYHYDQDFLTKYQYHSDAGIKLHHIVDHETEGPMIYGDYFHLVDGHDFNAPVAFKVKQGWYTRKPAHYAQTYIYEDDEYTEYLKTAWETLCLPFDVEMTYAFTSEPTKFGSDMGEITHFFGEEYRGHEYWLRRLVKCDSESNKLQFKRPMEGNRQGTLADKVGNHKYENSMLHDLYINAEYQNAHDELYHDNGTGWPRTIVDYRYLTGGVPYIVTYPGENFYEFDLSGNFYAAQDPEHRYAVAQGICYFVKQKEADGEYATIPVTDDIKGMEYAAGVSGYKMAGTFAHATNDEAAASVLNSYVKDMYVVSEDGTEFEKAAAKSSVLPFRGYVYKEAGSNGKPSRGLLIGGDVEYADPEEIEEEDPEQPETPEEEMQAAMEFWVQNGVLYIRTPEDADLTIYNMAGQAIRRIRAYAGLNRYSGLTPGIYLVATFKFAI